VRRVRVFTDQPLSPGHTVSLEAGPAQHVARVLRLAPGDPLTLFNGDGCDYPAVLESVARRSVSARVIGREAVDNESPLAVHLVQGISRGERMDWVVQKAVELGVGRLSPVLMERTVVRLDAERRRRRLEHWRGVMVAACEQCGRARLPRLEAPQPLPAWLANEGAGAGELRLFLDPEGAMGWGDVPGRPASVCLVVGPEGGLSEEERARLREAGFRGVRMGPRILRTETAAVAALTAVQMRWGDLA